MTEQNNTIKWTYDDMYKWYTKQHKINDEITTDCVAIVYESKRPSKKNQGVLEPFIRQNISWVGLAPLQNDTLFPNRLFLVYDDNKNQKQSMYFVFPTEKEDGTNAKFLAADHFTFLLDKSDKKRPCHFHSTIYVRGRGRYFAGHFKDFMPESFMLPSNTDNLFKNHQKEKPFLIDLISHPWNQLKKGGTRNYHKKIKNQETAQFIKGNEDFCDKWQEQLVKKAVVFGIKKDNKMCWTATFYKEGRVREAYGYSGLYYETPLSGSVVDYENEFQKQFVENFEFNV